MLYIKLTDQKGKTRAGHYNECQWGDNVTHTAEGEGTELCSNAFIHFYSGETLEEAIAIAILRDPVDGSYTTRNKQARAWLCQAENVIEEPLKCGAKTVTTIREVELPSVTTEQRVEVAIQISLLVYDEPSYVEWAEKWRSGEDRSRISANAAATAASAADAADAAASAAYAADAAAAADAAYAVASAAYAAAAAAAAADAAYAVASAVASAAYAADAAAAAAKAAANAAGIASQIKQIVAEVFFGGNSNGS